MFAHTVCKTHHHLLAIVDPKCNFTVSIRHFFILFQNFFPSQIAFSVHLSFRPVAMRIYGVFLLLWRPIFQKCRCKPIFGKETESGMCATAFPTPLFAAKFFRVSWVRLCWKLNCTKQKTEQKIVLQVNMNEYVYAWSLHIQVTTSSLLWWFVSIESHQTRNCPTAMVQHSRYTSSPLGSGKITFVRCHSAKCVCVLF